MLDTGPVEALRTQIAHDLQVDGSFDAETQIERRVTFLADTLLTTGMSTLVLGVSGGIDSAVAGRLCQLATERVRANGRDAVFIAMRLPYGVQRDEHDATTALAFISPDRTLTVDVRPASDACLSALTASGVTFPDAAAQDFIHGNIKARQRMVSSTPLPPPIRASSSARTTPPKLSPASSPSTVTAPPTWCR